MFKFVKGVLSDDAGRPSSQRLILLLVVLFTLAALAAAQVKSPTWALPVIPDSYVNLVQWLATVLGLGVFAPKVVNGWAPGGAKEVPDVGTSQG